MIVIHDVDETLRALVRRDAVPDTEVDVVFDAPTKDWSSRRNAPTVDMYLYDIREDARRNQVGRPESRVNGIVVSREPLPRWYKLSYLVTAWTQRPEDEHRLLSQVLRAFLLRDCLPRDLLVGALEGITTAMPLMCGSPPPQDRAISDIWSALGGDLKPSLDVVVIAPFDLSRDIPFGPPVLEGPTIIAGPDGPNSDGVGAAETRSARRSAPRAADVAGAAAQAREERSSSIEDPKGRVLRVREWSRGQPTRWSDSDTDSDTESEDDR